MSVSGYGITQEEEQDGSALNWLPRYYLDDLSVETRGSLEAMRVRIEVVEPERYRVVLPDGWKWMNKGHRVYIYDGMGHLRIEVLASPEAYRIAWISDRLGE